MSSYSAFITGATRGIGAAVAEGLAQKGYRLAIGGRDGQRLSDKAEELSNRYHIPCLVLPGDVGREDYVKQAFQSIDEKLGPLDVLINNAGISYIGLLTEMDVLEWEQVIQTNLTSVFLCCKYGAARMLQRKSGKIINISSVWGNVGASCEAAYSASKGGVNALTKALGKELAPSQIQVNAIACGIIDTEMNQCFSLEERRALEDEVPCGRFASPKEVSQMVMSLLEAPSYFTGQVITMDGGWI